MVKMESQKVKIFNMPFFQNHLDQNTESLDRGSSQEEMENTGWRRRRSGKHCKQRPKPSGHQLSHTANPAFLQFTQDPALFTAHKTLKLTFAAVKSISLSLWIITITI
jgi:hypothetical protein